MSHLMDLLKNYEKNEHGDFDEYMRSNLKDDKEYEIFYAESKK